jgi:hypothetical protein
MAQRATAWPTEGARGGRMSERRPGCGFVNIDDVQGDAALRVLPANEDPWGFSRENSPSPYMSAQTACCSP